ncbi:hypothetical protein PGIN_YH522_00108 [Porphyromonas gingivalis]|uniref:hypothetical protein n=1 Tax=Porphyromonas gingivalis TaxID=837 RepID=UPI000975079A|nr:hypothetical protein [Porphyromonas gingivalis]SJL30575.1 hypothetical protein PGIN_YH522_00108 [Porphyromonas gingivalis]
MKNLDDTLPLFGIFITFCAFLFGFAQYFLRDLREKRKAIDPLPKNESEVKLIEKHAVIKFLTYMTSGFAIIFILIWFFLIFSSKAIEKIWTEEDPMLIQDCRVQICFIAFFSATLSCYYIFMVLKYSKDNN